MKRTGTLFTALPVAVFILTLFSSVAFAGWVEVNRFTGTSYISDGMIKQVPKSEGEPWSIFDVNRRVITMVEPAQKSYMEIDTKEICREITKMMEVMMAEVPQEQRAMMEQMMAAQNKKQKPPSVTVSKIGGGGKIAGYDTVKYSVKVDGQSYKDIWITSDVGIMEDVKKFMKYALEMNEEMTGCTQMAGTVVERAPETTGEYTSLMERGWTMKEVSLPGGAVESEVESLEKRDIPASEFTVPAGYKKLDMMEMMGQMGR
jgi:hypothetical protein